MMITSASLRGRSGGTEAAVLITNVVTESASVTRTETALNRKAIENLRDDCNRWLGNTDMPAGPRKPGELADDIVRMIMTHDISSQSVRRWVRSQISVWLKDAKNAGVEPENDNSI